MLAFALVSPFSSLSQYSFRGADLGKGAFFSSALLCVCSFTSLLDATIDFLGDFARGCEESIESSLISSCEEDCMLLFFEPLFCG